MEEGMEEIEGNGGGVEEIEEIEGGVEETEEIEGNGGGVEETEEMHLGGINKSEQQYISSGVYGCVWKPGITNKGLKYKKYYVTKIH